MSASTAGRSISAEEFYRRFPEQRPDAADVAQVAGNYQRERDFDIAYAMARQSGLSHEASTWKAQETVYGRRLSKAVGVETEQNSAVARMPLSSPLPAVQAAVEQMQRSPRVVLPSGRQMAMRYGLPALGVLLGLYGIEALQDEPEPVAAAVLQEV